jgi:hypothetical protein
MSPPHQQLPPAALHNQPYHQQDSSMNTFTSTSTSTSTPNLTFPLNPSEDRQYRDTESTTGDIDPKTGKRRIDMQKAQDRNTSVMSDTSAAMPGALPSSPSREQATLPKSIPVSPARQPHNNLMAASSPSTSRLRSSSPRLQSPASTEIFERNVQEPIPIATLQNELSPAHIPNHVLTEDHIPAALEASAEAITSLNLNADEVEIVTATSHQPAGASLPSSSSTADVSSSLNAHLPPSLLHQASDASEHASLNASGFLPPPSHSEEENASSYGALDPNDVHRLSFISFADVVQSEHAHPTAASDLAGSRDSLHISSQPTASPRSPSSTYSSGGVVTPPLTLGHSNQIESALSRHADQSPVRSIPVGSPGTSSTHGELTIETMRQAVRKTASGDLGGVRSTNLSPVASTNMSPVASTVASEDLFARQGRSRTNT